MSKVAQREVESSSAQDEAKFYEVFLSSIVKKCQTGSGRNVEIGGYGIWSQTLQSSGVFNEYIHESIKSIGIFAAAKALELIEDGSSVILNVESDKLNKKVFGWLSKVMENATAQPANWQEYKCQQALLAQVVMFLSAANGRKVEISYVGEGTGFLKAKELAESAIKIRFNELQTLSN